MNTRTITGIGSISIVWAWACVLLFGCAAHAELAAVTPGYQIQFPKDSGSHPAFGLEWWYLTGWFQNAQGKPQGFQITFFRSRNEAADSNPSTFAPRQLLFAHVALSDPANGKLLRAERSARAGFQVAAAREGIVDVSIDDWLLRATASGYVTKITADDFALVLTLTNTQAPLLQGDHGYSRKGPQPESASYYFSLPHLKVQGTVIVKGHAQQVTGEAWFDHEWSSEYTDANIVGWDWLGVNLSNGDSLMAFRMRDAKQAQYWAGGTWRNAHDERTGEKNFAPEEIAWMPLRTWRSPRTGVEYPVAWRIKLGLQEITLRPLMDDQENDARGSVGVLYWEGAVEAMDAQGQIIGRGYLELTGYGERLQL